MRAGARSGSSASRRGRRLLRIVALASVVALVVLGSSAADLLSPAPSTAPPATPVLPESPTPPEPTEAAPTAAERPVVSMPPSVDASGTADVTDDVQALIDAAPDGSIIRLTPGGQYRVDGILRLEGRKDLDIDGAGATLEATTIVDTNRRTLYLRGSERIVIHDLTIVGVNPAPGVLDEAHQFEHGIWIDGGSDITIERVTIRRPRGDCVYLGTADGAFDWVQRVRLVDSTCRGAGRNGIAIVGASDVRIEGNTFEELGLHVVDIEPNRTDGHDGGEPKPVQGARRVAVVDNRVIGPIQGYFFAANGWGRVDELAVVGNVLTGTGMRITVQPLPGSGYIRSSVLIVGNTSDTAYRAGKGGAAMRFTRAVDLTVRDNTGPVEGADAALIEIRESCRVDIGGNSFPGGDLEVRGEPTTCPVPTAPTTGALDAHP